MTRVLIVDDDPLVQLAYGGALTRRGFQVESADDGVAALRAMHKQKPDVVVLDLMMPKLSGVDVLRVMRNHAALAKLPVIVFTNSYLDAETAQAAGLAAQKGLRKSQCTPAILADAIQYVLNHEAKEAVPSSETLSEIARALGSESDRISDQEWRENTRTQLLAGAKVTSAALRTAFEAWSSAAESNDRAVKLHELYRRLHFLTTLAGMAEHHRLNQMMTPLEALIFRLTEEPALSTPSVFSTISSALGIIDVLFEEAKAGHFGEPIAGKVLVVDDDAVSNRLVTWALTTANLRSRSIEDPIAGLELIGQEQFDLVLLDLEMPGLHGFEFCKRLRTLPAYAKTPVIYVTIHSDFENRSHGALVGGDDLIAKPVLPLELALKTTMHLLRVSTPKPTPVGAQS